MVIGAPSLPGLFGDAVYGSGLHNTVLGSIVPGGCGSENGNARWPENLPDFPFPGKVEDVEKRIHVEVPGPIGKLFSSGTQHSGHEVDLLNFVMHHHVFQGSIIGGVEHFKRTRTHKGFTSLADIAGDYLSIAKAFP